jgi:photosystem II stability/assembly factor-like uncharacterized protein
MAALAALMPAASGAAGLNALPNLALYERYVAIDGTCSWPRLTLLPGGEISAVIWPHPNHGLVAGAAECWNSSDGGRTWSRAGVPVPNAPGTSRMNVAAGLAPDGTYVAVVAGWNHAAPDAWSVTTDEERKHRSQFHRPPSVTVRAIAAASRDGGRTWSRYGDVPDLPGSLHHLAPYGPIRPLEDGRAGAMLYGDASYFFTSSDQGRTWQKRGQVGPPGGYNETAWIILANHDLYAAARSGDEHGLDGFRSSDGGVTWRKECPLTLPLQHPGDLLRLPDGRILLTYGVRNEGLWAVCARFGDPTARDWSAPLCLVDLEGATDEPRSADPLRDGGYPSTIALSDGTLVTAYYCRGIASHNRYHTGVVRWRAPGPKS